MLSLPGGALGTMAGTFKVTNWSERSTTQSAALIGLAPTPMAVGRMGLRQAVGVVTMYMQAVGVVTIYMQAVGVVTIDMQI